MAVPPKGDPERPLHLAARSMGLLGLLSAALGTCVSMVFTFAGPAMGAGVVRWVMVAVGGVYLGAGIGFVICATYLKKHRQWAAIVGIVLTSLALLMILLGLVVLLLQLATGTAEGVPLVQLVIQLLFLAAFAQLLVYLIQSMRAISLHQSRNPTGYGFQPIYGSPAATRGASDTDTVLPPDERP